MKQEQESFKITKDCKHKSITSWVCKGLCFDKNWLKNAYFTIGVVYGGKLIAGIILHDIRKGHDVWLTIYATDKRWCQRRVLRLVFGLAFDELKVNRINILVDTDNNDCLKLVQGLGFKQEGLLRQYRDNKKDCYFMGMLRKERKF